VVRRLTVRTCVPFLLTLEGLLLLMLTVPLSLLLLGTSSCPFYLQAKILLV
jgi:hypothetical protein